MTSNFITAHKLFKFTPKIQISFTDIRACREHDLLCRYRFVFIEDVISDFIYVVIELIFLTSVIINDVYALNSYYLV